ncbi:MAG: 2OG-Fe(II) oxygenase [Nevskiaceae bacterium]
MTTRLEARPIHPVPGFGTGAFRELGIYVDEAFLPPALCRDLAAATRATGKVEPAGVHTQARDYVDEGFRRTKAVQLAKPLRQAVMQRFEQARPDVARHFGIPLSGAEIPQFLRYGAGDFFKTHRDSGHGEYAARRVSAVVFLNDPCAQGGGYAGGELKLYGLLKGEPWARVGLPVAPGAGLLVAFPANIAHEVGPVTAGERLTVVTWFHA